MCLSRPLQMIRYELHDMLWGLSGVNLLEHEETEHGQIQSNDPGKNGKRDARKTTNKADNAIHRSYAPSPQACIRAL